MNKSTAHLGEKPILELFIGMALPIAVGMLLHGLYNVVDAIFVTRALGANAMGSISIVFPIQMIVYALATLIGSGMASIMARQLGAKQQDKAQATLAMAMRLTLGTAIVITLGIYINLDEILTFLGVSENLMPFAREYLLIITIWSIPIIFLNQVVADALRAEGKAMLMMATMVLAAVLNIVLDAVFIYGLDSGVDGVAYATVISQAVELVIGGWFFVSGKTQLAIKPLTYSTDTKILNEIILLGIPIFISHAGVSIFIAFTNFSLAKLANIDNDLYISAYGLIGRVIIFVVLPLIAMTISFQTIAGYNYGAKHFARVRQTLKVGLTSSLAYGIFTSGLIVLYPNAILGIFTDEPTLIIVSANISFWVFIGFPLANAHGLSCAFFQAIGKAKEALFLSSLRIYIILLPSLVIFPLLFGIDGLWWAFPLADVGAFAIVAVFLFKERAKLIMLSTAKTNTVSH